MSSLAEKIQKLNMVKRGNCRDCGNPWWFDKSNSWVCTICAKTYGKSSSEKEDWKPKQ